jgi:hypothetical protein
MHALDNCIAQSVLRPSSRDTNGRLDASCCAPRAPHWGKQQREHHWYRLESGSASTNGGSTFLPSAFLLVGAAVSFVANLVIGKKLDCRADATCPSVPGNDTMHLLGLHPR